MNYGRNFRRCSTRLAGYDYSTPGSYFVTICSREKEWLFGEIIEKQMQLSAAGLLLQTAWLGIGDVYPGIIPDAFVVMPNHVHGIIIIKKDVGARLPRPRTLPRPDGSPRPGLSNMGDDSPGGATPPLHGVIGLNKCESSQRLTLGRVVAFFKYHTTKLINRQRGTPGIPVWQRNYHDHIIRDQAELAQIRQYMLVNPINWPNDPENSSPVGAGLPGPAMIVP